MNPLDHIMGVEEASDRWGLTPAYIKNLCAAGRVKAKKIGKTWVLDTNQDNPAQPDHPQNWRGKDHPEPYKPKPDEKLYSMNEVVKLVNRTRQTLLNWESEGLLNPKRDSRMWRLYTQDDLDRINEIKKAKADLMMDGVGKPNWGKLDESFKEKHEHK